MNSNSLSVVWNSKWGEWFLWIWTFASLKCLSLLDVHENKLHQQNQNWYHGDKLSKIETIFVFWVRRRNRKDINTFNSMKLKNKYVTFYPIVASEVQKLGSYWIHKRSKLYMLVIEIWNFFWKSMLQQLKGKYHNLLTYCWYDSNIVCKIRFFLWCLTSEWTNEDYSITERNKHFFICQNCRMSFKDEVSFNSIWLDGISKSLFSFSRQ